MVFFSIFVIYVNYSFFNALPFLCILTSIFILFFFIICFSVQQVSFFLCNELLFVFLVRPLRCILILYRLLYLIPLFVLYLDHIFLHCILVLVPCTLIQMDSIPMFLKVVFPATVSIIGYIAPVFLLIQVGVFICNC